VIEPETDEPFSRLGGGGNRKEGKKEKGGGKRPHHVRFPEKKTCPPALISEKEGKKRKGVTSRLFS